MLPLLRILWFILFRPLPILVAVSGTMQLFGQRGDIVGMSEWFQANLSESSGSLFLIGLGLALLFGPQWLGNWANGPRRDARSILFQCKQHFQTYSIRSIGRGEIALRVSSRRKLHNLTIIPSRLKLGLALDITSPSSRPLSVSYRHGRSGWVALDISNRSQNKAVWEIPTKTIWVWSFGTVDVETVWEETHPENGAYTDNFVVPTIDPVFVVDAEGFSYKVAFAGHEEEAGSPCGAFTLKGQLDSDQQIRLRWWPNTTAIASAPVV